MSKDTKIQPNPATDSPGTGQRKPSVDELPDGSGNDATKRRSPDDEGRFDAG